MHVIPPVAVVVATEAFHLIFEGGVDKDFGVVQFGKTDRDSNGGTQFHRVSVVEDVKIFL